MTMQVPIVGFSPATSPAFSIGSTKKTEVPVIRRLEDFNKEILQSTKPVLVKFSMSMCGGCQATKPHIQEISDRHGDKIKVVEVELAVGKEKRDINRLGSDYKIFDKKNLSTGELIYEGRGVPTLSLFVNGEEVEQFNFEAKHFEDLNTVLSDIESTIVQIALKKAKG